MPSIAIQASGSQHTQITGWSSNYAISRTTATSMSGSGGTGKVIGQSRDNLLHFTYRYFLRFDTSAIRPIAKITSLRMMLVMIARNVTGGHDNIYICKGDWSSYTPLDPPANMQAIFTIGLNAAADALWQNTNVNLNTQYLSGELDPEWLVRAGTTYYCLRSGKDISATPIGSPETQSAIQVAKGGYDPVPAWSPTLYITYRARRYFVPPVVG